MSDLIKTAFYQNHLALGAKMVPYSGFEMPVSYSGLKDEHNAVRNHVGMFDVSHMGEFIVKGPNALCFLQYITSNDVAEVLKKTGSQCQIKVVGGIKKLTQVIDLFDKGIDYVGTSNFFEIFQEVKGN